MRYASVNVDVDIDIEDFVSQNKYDVIEALEAYEQCYVFEHKTLVDKYKLEWFNNNWQAISLEQLESLVS